MVTGTQVATFLRQRFGDTDSNFLSDALLLTVIDQGQNVIVGEFMELRRLKGFVISAYQEAVSIPADCQMIEIVWNAKGLKKVIDKVTPAEFFARQQAIDGAIGDPVIWTEMENKIYLWPAYSAASNTTTITATMTTTSSPVVATTSQLTSKGIARIDSEDIEYTHIATNGTLGGVTRGAGGTDAATHASAATVTQLPLQALYRRNSASVTTLGETLDIAPQYRQLLESYSLYLLYLAEGSSDKASTQYQVYSQLKQEYAYTAEKADLAGNIRVRDLL